jgi:small-conductance mechanosensitive channel
MNSFLNTELFTYGSIRITVFSLVVVVMAIVIARVIVWSIGKVLHNFFSKKGVDTGRQVAVVQILKYLIYIFTFLVILKAMGIGLTGLMLGSGALLVGIGFGLQQTFNDFLSGIILLFEGGVNVGDDLLVEGLFGSVYRIGLRTTEVITRDDVKIIIPNSKIVGSSVTNWSHSKRPARFSIDVGVSYASDIDQVERILLECAHEQQSIRKTPGPSVQLMNYGDSSVDFRLYFFTREFILSERLKSDVRKRVFKKLAEHNVVIPFPQRDVWMKSSD